MNYVVLQWIRAVWIHYQLVATHFLELDKPSTSSQTTKTAKNNKKTTSQKVTDLGKEKSSVVTQSISPKTENAGNKTFGSGIENKTSTSAVLKTTIAKNDILNTKTKTMSGENKTRFA
jgi:hypothetical protein